VECSIGQAERARSTDQRKRSPAVGIMIVLAGFELIG
jgi:hypothetical protein